MRTPKTLTKENDASREAEGRATTSIRPVSLQRVKVVIAHMKGENVTDFLSTAADERVKREVATRGIKLTGELAFKAA